MEGKETKNKLISNKIIFLIIIGALLIFGLPLSFPVSEMMCAEEILGTSGLSNCETRYIGAGSLLTVAGIVIIIFALIYCLVKIFKKNK